MKSVEETVAAMSLEEKAAFCSGADTWHTMGIERLGVPAVMMADGPHGLRKQTDTADALGLDASAPATCFPSEAAVAASWDTSLAMGIGEALAEECLAEQIAILLGPGLNIKRSPLCGRNFEYFSEDPFLSGELGAAMAVGIQKRGVSACPKHFAANNQETRRMAISANMDEQTLREIYLKAFETVVKKARPKTIMCSYNKINGTYASQNKYLLTDILRDEFGFGGFVISDWGAVSDRAAGIQAGLDLEMPASYGASAQRILEAIQNGELRESELDLCVSRILSFVESHAHKPPKNGGICKNAHHALAREAAAQSMVLLKNEDGILPLSKSGTIAVIGAFAKTPRFQGGGSSHTNPTAVDVLFDEMEKAAPGARLSYAAGYRLDTDAPDEGLLEEAGQLAEKSDMAVIVAGLPDIYEAESYDRAGLGMPHSHNQLIERVAGRNPNTVVVLMNGAPVAMPWAPAARGILEACLGGQGAGWAIASLLFGDQNPCGKLAETFPLRIEDTPCYVDFPGDKENVNYREGLFVGYRHYDKRNMPTLFPFGHGLSYTTFEYKDMHVSKEQISESGMIEQVSESGTKEQVSESGMLGISIEIENTGERFGREIVQLYIAYPEIGHARPVKELRGFTKVPLQPGEAKTVIFDIDVKDACGHYDARQKKWRVASGPYCFMVGASSRDIRAQKVVQVRSSSEEPFLNAVTRDTLISDLLADARTAEYTKELVAKHPITTGLGETGDAQDSVMMKTISDAQDGGMMKKVGDALKREMPLRSIQRSSVSPISHEEFCKAVCELDGMVR